MLARERKQGVNGQCDRKGCARTYVCATCATCATCAMCAACCVQCVAGFIRGEWGAGL